MEIQKDNRKSYRSLAFAIPVSQWPGKRNAAWRFNSKLAIMRRPHRTIDGLLNQLECVECVTGADDQILLAI